MIRAYGLIAGIAALGMLAGLAVLYLESVKRAAIAEERRERMADAVELIRETDKALGVARKATNADLCRELGGTTVDGVCQ